MMDRTLTFKQNSIILHKAIKYQRHGIVGIDLAGPERRSFSIKKHAPLFRKARKNGLGLTIHTGEGGNLKEMWYVVQKIRPERIGHGIKSVADKALMAEVAKNNITLEICPTSNLQNSIVTNLKELKKIAAALLKNHVKFTINTDGPEMYRTNIHKELEILKKNNVLTSAEISQCAKWAFEASFIKN